MAALFRTVRNRVATLGGVALLLGCSTNECPFPDYAPAPVRLKLTDDEGELICVEEVIAVTDLRAAEPPADGEDLDLDDFPQLEVVTYNNLDNRGRVIEGAENLCEHRVHRWVVDGGVMDLLLFWETEDGELLVSDPVSPPLELDECGNPSGPLIELQLHPF